MWQARASSSLRQALSDIEVALYVHGDDMYVKLDMACLPVTEDLRAQVESLDERRRRFTLTIGGKTALDHEYTVPRDPLARFDDTPFCDLTDEDLPTMIARILRNPDEPRETIAIWSRGLTIEG